MKKAFTLAEVLITMSIIAAIAMLTLPSMIKNYKNKIYASTLKQVVAQVEDATKAVIADEHADSFYETTAGIINNCTVGTEGGPCYLFRKYFKIKRECSSSTDINCAPSNGYMTANGTNAGNLFGKCIRIANGATICMEYNISRNATFIGFDVNGPDLPNIIGVDAFYGKIDKNGNIVDEYEASVCGTEEATDGNIKKPARGCLAKVIENSWVIKD